MRCLLVRFAALMTISLVMAGPANAQTIGVFNTGVSNTGTLLPDGSVDPHYAIVSAPSPAFSSAYVAGSVPATYVPNNSTSKWLAPGPDLSVNFIAGTYVYRTTFDLTGSIPSTAVITGRFSSDNNSEIFLNGTSTGISSPFNGFGSFTPFTINSGFIAGLNTLEFRVFEPGDSATGLRVEMSGTVSPVPEPSSLGLVALGAMAGLRWKRRQSQKASV